MLEISVVTPLTVFSKEFVAVEVSLEG